MTSAPTHKTYTSLDTAYDYFNRELFGGQLPGCLITMQRHKGAYGYFSGGRFINRDDAKEIADEIALNPAHFASCTPTHILSTLAHEMVHLWQHHFGTRPRGGYHDKEWAAKMREIGLIPSNTGKPGGKETGEKLSHYIEADGGFAKACAAHLATGAVIFYHDRAGEGKGAAVRKRKAASKTKYTCPLCEVNAWAKPGVNLICGDCGEELEAETEPAGE